MSRFFHNDAYIYLLAALLFASIVANLFLIDKVLFP